MANILYGGTKEEMERLLEDASKISGIEYDISSYADIVDAIHVVQEEMGITGTTAEEAADTIEGSINSAEAAWTNWLTGLADDNADMEELTNQLIETASTAVSNIVPRLGQIASTFVASIPQLLSGLVTGINEHMPEAMETISTLISDLIAWITDPNTLATLLNIGVQLIAGIAEGIAQGLGNLIANIPSMFGEWLDGVLDFFGIESPSKLFRDQVGRNIMLGWAEGITDNVPEVVSAMDGASRTVTGSGQLAFSVAGSGNASLVEEVRTLRRDLGDIIYYNTPQYTQRQFARAVSAVA